MNVDMYMYITLYVSLLCIYIYISYQNIMIQHEHTWIYGNLHIAMKIGQEVQKGAVSWANPWDLHWKMGPWMTLAIPNSWWIFGNPLDNGLTTKGKSYSNRKPSIFPWRSWDFPVIVPLNQSIDLDTRSECIQHSTQSWDLIGMIISSASSF